jgi:hypothetical protein
MEKPENRTAYLEPRVAKLETGLEMLARDVASLVQVVRDQGNNIEEQIKQLAIGVTQAAAPRRTDWQTLIATVMLIMAIGTAVVVPLNQTAQENKTALAEIEQVMHEHEKLQLHPVGQALMGRLEGQLQIHVKEDERDKEAMTKAWERNIDLLTTRIDSRLNKVEASELDRNKAELDELRQLKYRAFLYHMGPCPAMPNGNEKLVK